MLALLLIAAQITNVADAGDDKHALELDLSATYGHSRTETRITREHSTAAGISLEDELHHLSTTDDVNFRLAVGLWHDLELHVLAPLVLREQQDWRFYDPAASTLASNTIDISGCARLGSCTAVSPVIAAPGQSRRKGFRDPTIGLAWGPINEEREAVLRPELFPKGDPVSTWVVGFDYTLPLPGAVDDPSHFGAASSLELGGAPSAGPESRKAHVFTLWTAFSKRFRVVEPYLRISASLPVAAKAAYDNCSHPENLSDVAPVNCADSFKGQAGYKPAPEGALTLGSEFVVHEGSNSRAAFDLRSDVRYRGPARDYTQVSDALGKLTYEDEYATMTGALGFYARVASWLTLRVDGSAGFDTGHFLTHEEIGDERDAIPGIQLSSGTGKAAPDQNPAYDFRVDQVGRRLHAETSFIWGLSGSLALTF